MRTRQLGTTEMFLTTVGFGAWAIGGPEWAFGWGPQDDRESVAAIHKALDLGVNWIDTAAVYGLGHSEQLVGEALRGRRDQVMVATKCSLRWGDNSNVYSSLAAASVREEAEQSLRRLGVDRIDLYQIHWPFPDEQIEEGWSTMAELVHEGKLRHVGVSNFSVPQMKRAQAIHPIASIQPPYSMINRRIEADVLPFCVEHGIGVIAYSPMQSGLLTGSFTKGRVADLDSRDWRRRDKSFQEPILTKALELVERLQPIAERTGHTMAQLAIAWILKRQGVTAAIVGARRPTQIEETAQAADWVVDDADEAAIARILEEVAVPEPPPLR
jgi:aryl-alcohol dehydrogenase-like predicted oxidoreductase